jgi:hypothetical protein
MTAILWQMLEKVGLLLKMDLSVEFSSVHGQVLAQWPKMFQILSQFCKSACIQMSDYVEPGGSISA